MPDMVVCFSLYKVPQVPKCPNMSVVLLKGWGYMLLDDNKTIFVDDSQNSSNAQNITSFSGKILRIRPNA
jgi:hypothetical protein